MQAIPDISKAKEISKTFIEKAKKEENDAINKVVAEHAGQEPMQEEPDVTSISEGSSTGHI